jgi:hypothetical protein
MSPLGTVGFRQHADVDHVADLKSGPRSRAAGVDRVDVIAKRRNRGRVETTIAIDHVRPIHRDRELENPEKRGGNKSPLPENGA